MRYTKKILFLILGMVSVQSSWSAVPDGYYSSCEGKTGQALLKALSEKISNHTKVSYDGLWEVYEKSDVRADGTLWDIYSTKAWPVNFTHCGNYSVVGDCVNREHSLPKSWWGGGKADQYSDAFHLYPTDGKVNGQRSNYPFGECANGISLAANGSVKPLGRLGSCTFNGFSGTVFEPDDEYKGDLARSYFYMATAYNSIISGWTQGNGNQFFAGNSFPVFKSWAINLLLKWARQDQVSRKEEDRNDAIFTFQHNRNPFIDYPELVEYIWGDKVGEAWYPGGSREPAFDSPVQNTVINLGIAAVRVPRSVNITVKGRNLESNVTLSASGAFSVSPTQLSAEQVNAGATVAVTVLASSPGDAEGSLTLRSGTLSRSVDLIAEIEAGLPVSISDVTTESFRVNWVNLHHDDPSVAYTLSVAQNDQQIDGYPKSVKASAESFTVTGLEPSTKYSVTFGNVPGDIDIPVLAVTTADPIPSIQLLFDGKLDFATQPGEASDIAELLLEADNISSEITISVAAPFEVSTDKNSWSRTTTLDPEEERFYMRVASTEAGTYETVITVTAGSYTNDDATATATVKANTGFLEDWENVADLCNKVPTYSTTTFVGAACSWAVTNGGFNESAQDMAFNGTIALRFGKDATSSLAMNEDKTGGLGTVTFEAAKWNESEANAKIRLEYSTDGGQSWTEAKSFTISSSTATSFSSDINVTGNGRIRLVQTSGKRWFLDNIAITDYSSMSAVNELDYHSWDTFCREGKLVIESRDATRLISVYGLDGIRRFHATVAGATELQLPAGLYIVTDGSFSRRVLVK